MTKPGQTSLVAGTPTRITVERDGVEQTVIFSDMKLNIDRDVVWTTAAAVDDMVKTYFYLDGETWRLEGHGSQIQFRQTDGLMERFVAAHSLARRLMDALGYNIETSSTEEEIEEAVQTLHELRAMRDRLDAALAVLAGEKVAVAPDTFYDEAERAELEDHWRDD